MALLIRVTFRNPNRSGGFENEIVFLFNLIGHEPVSDAARNDDVILGAIPLLSSRVERESGKVVGDLGLTPNGFGLLCALRRSGFPFCMTPSELYDVVILSPAGVAGQLYKMERAGLVERSNDPEDRRLNRASLSERGQKVVHSTIGDFVRRHDWLLKPLSESERDTLTALLQRILASLEHGQDEPTGH